MISEVKMVHTQASNRKPKTIQNLICSKKFHEQVEEASANFWSKNQISGFTNNGEPIRTNKPRAKQLK